MNVNIDMDRIDFHRLVIDNVPNDMINNVLYVQDDCVREVSLSIREGIPVWKYNLTRMNGKQIQMIRLGLKQNLDVSVYADYKLSYIKMDAYREHMRAGYTVPAYILLRSIATTDLICELAALRRES